MAVKILRRDKDPRPPRLKTAAFLGLLFCAAGLVFIGSYGMWPLGLVYVSAGLAGFLHLRSGRLLMICASCIGALVFWMNQLARFGLERAAFFSRLNLLDMFISTAIFALIIYYFSLPRVREVFSRR